MARVLQPEDPVVSHQRHDAYDVAGCIGDVEDAVGHPVEDHAGAGDARSDGNRTYSSRGRQAVDRKFGVRLRKCSASAVRTTNTARLLPSDDIPTNALATAPADSPPGMIC
jgi:hypothetical protein